MDALNFAYWLHGFTELTRGQTPDPAQWKAIREHLDLVFKKVTPQVEVSVTQKTAQDWAEYFKKHPMTGQTVGIDPNGIMITC